MTAPIVRGPVPWTPPRRQSSAPLIVLTVLACALFSGIVLFAAARYLGAAAEWSSRGCHNALLMPLFHGQPGTWDYCRSDQ